MNQIFSKELIFDRIKDSGFPFWALSLQTGFRNTVNIMTYFGSDFEDNDSDDTKIEKSIKRLENVLNTFPPESVFLIEIKNSRQANGSGIIGPLTFSVASSQPEPAPPSAQPTPPPAAQTMLSGFTFDEALKGIEDKLTAKFDNDMKAYKLEVEKQRQEELFKRRLAELEEREKELKELKRGYESGVAKTADVLFLAGKKLLGVVFPELANQLPAADTPPELGEPSAGKDEKMDVLNDFAEYLYKNFDKDSISKLFSNLKEVQKNGTQNQNVKSCGATE